MKQLKIQNLNDPALVDDEDLDRLSKFKWSASTKKSIRRVLCLYGGPRKSSKTRTIPLANEVMLNFDVMFDHKDRNKLNNQKSNLRQATTSQNTANRAKYFVGLSKFKGVSWAQRLKWSARIACKKTKYHLGYFETEIDAARAYNDAATKLFGEFAVLNDV